MNKLLSLLLLGCIFSIAPDLSAEWTHPNMFLNMAEIGEIKTRVQSGKEPWKAAYAQLIKYADEGVSRRPASLKYSREIIQRDGCQGRCTSDFTAPYALSHNENEDRLQCTDAAYYLIHTALAWHITGLEKYAEGARKQIDTWYFIDSTRMEPKYAGGDDVAGTNSFSAIVWGVELSWPFLSPEVREKLKQWHKTYLSTLGPPSSCSTNRCYWKGTASMMCAIIAEDQAVIDKTIEMYKLANMDYDRPGSIKDEDKDEKRYLYRMFCLNALQQIVEMARHHGVDIYTFGTRDGKWKIERSWDYYAQFTRDPSLWEQLEHRYTDPERVYKSHDKAPYEIALALKGKSDYSLLLSKLKPGRPLIRRDANYNLSSCLHAVTLTHSAGTFAYKIFDKSGKVLGTLGAKTPVSQQNKSVGSAVRSMGTRERPTLRLSSLNGTSAGAPAAGIGFIYSRHGGPAGIRLIMNGRITGK